MMRMWVFAYITIRNLYSQVGNPASWAESSDCLEFSDGQRLQIVFSLVTMRTRSVWSKAVETHSPSFSEFQSNPEIGWVDKVTFCSRDKVPATPSLTPSLSFMLRWDGYSLQTQTLARINKSDQSRSRQICYISSIQSDEKERIHQCRSQTSPWTACTRPCYSCHHRITLASHRGQ